MEGFMDVIRASVVGINNCVATMGTAFTKEQALLLKKTTNNIILCFDGDNAGDEATDKAIQVLKEIDVIAKQDVKQLTIADSIHKIANAW